MNFFDFFGNKFDYGNCVVCIRKGQRTTKEEVNEELNCHSRITAARAGGGKSPGTIQWYCCSVGNSSQVQQLVTVSSPRSPGVYL